jgi:arginase
MKVTIILASYDSGNYHGGCGQGPDAIISGGLVDELALHGHEATVEDIEKVGDEQTREISTGFAVCNAVAEKVAAARKDGRFPVVLAGNCLTTAGAIAGEKADSVAWFDQHADINTPETSTSGFLDGMALATLLGLCWRPLANAIPDFAALKPWRAMLVGARDLDPAEKRLLDDQPVIRAKCAEAAGKAAKLVEAGAKRTHLHIDLDVIDPDELQVNRYASAGGPSPEALEEAVCNLVKALPVTGVTLSAYDPIVDPSGEVPPVVGKLLVGLLGEIGKGTKA